MQKVTKLSYEMKRMVKSTEKNSSEAYWNCSHKRFWQQNKRRKQRSDTNIYSQTSHESIDKMK